MFKLYLEKAEESEIKLPTSIGSLEKQECFPKYSPDLKQRTPVLQGIAGHIYLNAADGESFNYMF